MLAVSSSLPIHNIKELRDYAQSAGRQLSYASAGEGSGYHLMAELFKLQTQARRAPCALPGHATRSDGRGGGPGGHDVRRSGTEALHRLGQAAPDRGHGQRALGLRAGTPTFASQGVNNMEGNSWFAIFAPSGTPPDAIAKLNGAINTSLSSPEMLAVLKANGYLPVGGTPPSSAAWSSRTWRNGRTSCKRETCALPGNPSRVRVQIDQPHTLFMGAIESTD